MHDEEKHPNDMSPEFTKIWKDSIKSMLTTAQIKQSGEAIERLAFHDAMGMAKTCVSHAVNMFADIMTQCDERDVDLPSFILRQQSALLGMDALFQYIYAEIYAEKARIEGKT